MTEPTGYISSATIPDSRLRHLIQELCDLIAKKKRYWQERRWREEMRRK